MRMRQLFVLMAILLLSFAGDLHSAEDKSISTRITSDRMRYDAVKQRVIFDGNVYVKRPDFELRAKTITVVLEKAKKSTAQEGQAASMQAGQIERIIAENNVRIEQDGKVGTAGKMTYTLSDRKVVMENKPVLVDGSNRISGRVINFYTADGRSEVLGVEAHFSTNDKGSGDPLNIPGVTPSSSQPKPGSGKK